MKLLLLLFVLGAAACTRPNPAVCCLDDADCAAAGIPKDRRCAEGLVCVAHECQVPEVVECEDNTQCTAAAPVCELSTNECRGCRADGECDTGVCLDGGTCAPETESVYVSPTGQDGQCTREMPCATLTYAASKLTISRFRLVFAPGTYIPAAGLGQITVADIGTLVYFHGHGARISALVNWPSVNTVLSAAAINIRELEIVRTPSAAPLVQVSKEAFFERVTLRGGGVNVPEARLSINGALIVAEGRAIDLPLAAANSMINISNLVVYGGAPISFGSHSGTVQSSTIAWTGSASGSGAQGVTCINPPLTIQNSIIWTPTAGTLPPVSDCILQNVIAGPVEVSGTTNIDPQFVDGAAGDLHLKPASPARDAADIGPPLDFDGDARPQGLRFDIGADEVVP